MFSKKGWLLRFHLTYTICVGPACCLDEELAELVAIIIHLLVLKVLVFFSILNRKASLIEIIFTPYLV